MRRWLQFRLATFFMVITLAAIGVDYFRRRQPLFELARRHEEEADAHSSSASPTTVWMISPVAPVPTEEQRSEFRRSHRQLAENHRRLARKFRRAAWLPWIPTARDAADAEFHFFTLDLTDLPEPSE